MIRRSLSASTPTAVFSPPQPWPKGDRRYRVPRLCNTSLRAVTQLAFEASAGMAGTPGQRRDAIDECECLRDVVDVPRSRDDVERGAISVADQTVLAARLPPVDRRRTGRVSHFFSADVGAVHARVGPVEFAGRVQLSEQDPGVTGRRSLPVASGPGDASRSPPSGTPSSNGRSCHAMYWCRTYRMP